MLAGWAGAEAKSLHPDYQLMRGEVQQYGDWLVGCDNNASCTMVGFPRPVPATPDCNSQLRVMGIEIGYADARASQPEVEIFPFGVATEDSASNAKCVTPFQLNIAGKPLDRTFGFSRTSLMSDEAKAVLCGYGNDRSLRGIDRGSGRVLVRFPADQFRIALLAMQRRRADLKKQLANAAIDNLPGELPDGSTMPVPERLKRIPAYETIMSGFVPILREGRCGNDFMVSPHQYHFANGARLWSFECSTKVGTGKTLWEMAPDANSIAAPLTLPEPRDGQIRAGADGLGDAAFDWDFGILRSYQYLNGREDCGTFRAWGYTQNGWHLLERREMPLCKGLSPDNWIRTHYTPTDGAGPDE